jgi:hypothetical protein
VKYLYANGDSWTHGDEIPDRSDMNSASTRYYNTWPWFLSQQANIPVCINDAQGGASNARIFRRTNDFINNWIGSGKDPKDLFICIGWTSPERSEVSSGEGIYSVTIQHCLRLHNLPVDETSLKKYHEAFYENYVDSYGEHITAMYMVNLRTLCKGLGIKYYDFIAVGKPPAHWQEIIKKKWNLEIENMYLKSSWLEEVFKNNWPVYEYKHPQIETHKIWAETLSKEIK